MYCTACCLDQPLACSPVSTTRRAARIESRVSMPEQGDVVGVEAHLARQALGVETPAFGVGVRRGEPAQQRQFLEFHGDRELEVVTGHGFVERGRLARRAGPRSVYVVGVGEVDAWAAAVEGRRHVIRTGGARRLVVRNRPHLAVLAGQPAEPLRRLGLGPLDRGLAASSSSSALVHRSEWSVRSRSKTSCSVATPKTRPPISRYSSASLGDDVQAGLVQLVRGPVGGRVQLDQIRVHPVAAGEPGQARVVVVATVARRSRRAARRGISRRPAGPRPG